ncbi:hypothetical protein R6Q59_002684 [Mikania micrantha]
MELLLHFPWNFANLLVLVQDHMYLILYQTFAEMIIVLTNAYATCQEEDT